jgi:hypothetical protein
MTRSSTRARDPADTTPLTISLQTLARRLDAHRSTVRRWLRDAGVHPVAVGQGRNGAIRYRWRDVESWLESLEYVE